MRKINRRSAEKSIAVIIDGKFDSETLRDTTNRYNAYRAGRLGGIPHLGDTYVSFSQTKES